MPHAFRTAVEAKDLDALTAVLVEDVVFHGPVLFRPLEGRDAVLHLIAAVAEILTDLEYTDELADDGSVVLRFRARVEDKELEGIDFLELDAHGAVTRLTVFMRPMSALTRFSALMAERVGATR